MEFRVVSTNPTGVYGSSKRLTSQEEVSLFLSVVQDCFPDQVDNPVMNEVSLREFVDRDEPPPFLIYAGDVKGWKILLAPVINEAPLPSEN